MISIIAAVALNGAIGVDGRIPWRLQSDHQRYMRTVQGSDVIMGRRTWESHEVKHQRAIVVSPSGLLNADRHTVVRSPSEALRQVITNDVYVLGGQGIFEAFLPIADMLELTFVHAVVQGADAYFPPFAQQEWIVDYLGMQPADEHNEFSHSYVRFSRPRRRR